MNKKFAKLALRKTEFILPWAKLKIFSSTFFLSLVFVACNQKAQYEELKSITEFERISPKYATGFAIDKYQNFQVLHILRPFNDKADTVSYLLLPESMKEVPKPFKDFQLVRTPIKNFIALSTTHVALADGLDATDKIVGLTSPEYIYNSKIRKRLENKDLVPIGDGETLNQERILSLNPSLIMASGFSQASFERNYKPVLELGIPVLINSEWMEESMLGRTEWLKVLGLLLNKSDLADRKFEEIEKEYLRLAKIGRSAPNKPLVIGGLPYKGVWSVAGAKSYIATLLTDAGASWNWANDSSSVSLQMDFESVYPIGLKAEYWLRAGSTQSKEALLAVDERLADFKAYKTGNIFNNNKRISPNNMGNDYWESGLVNPHLILKDLIQILHPDLIEGDSLYYYTKLE